MLAFVGTVAGLVSSTHCQFTISWNNGAVGNYNGAFGFDGVLTGVTYDQTHPGNQATFVVTDRQFPDDNRG